MGIGLSGPLYQYTNETLEAVVSGLGLNEKDNLIAVAGSGDLAFAALATGAKVVAVDSDKSQIELVEKRAGMLRRHEFQSFLDDGDPSVIGYSGPRRNYFLARKNYFSKEGRLEAVAKRLDQLDICSAQDIFSFCEERRGQNKVYLSNCLSYSKDKLSGPRVTRALERTSKNLPSGGVVYVADHDMIVTLNTSYCDSIRGKKPEFKYKDNLVVLPSTLMFDKDASIRASFLEADSVWVPGVYRKI